MIHIFQNILKYYTEHNNTERAQWTLLPLTDFLGASSQKLNNWQFYWMAVGLMKPTMWWALGLEVDGKFFIGCLFCIEI